MGSCASHEEEFDIEKKLTDLETALLSYNDALSDEAKSRLNDIKNSTAELDRVKKNVENAKVAVGSSKVTVDKNAYVVAMSDCLRSLQKMKVKLNKLRAERDEARSKAKEARMKKDDNTVKVHLAAFSECKKKITRVEGSIARMNEAIKNLQNSEISEQMMDTIKKVESAMASIVTQIDSLNPEELDDKFVEFNSFIDEIDGVTAASNAQDDEDDMDDFLAMIDRDIEADKNVLVDLPVAPTASPSRETAKKESKSSSEKVAELE